MVTQMKNFIVRALSNVWGITSLFIILILLVAATYVAVNDENARNLLIGALGSLLASVVFAAVIQYGDTPENRMTKMIGDNLSRIEAIRQNLQDREQSGVLSVTDKYKHQHQFWFGILQRSNKRLDMMGNSLSGWIGQRYRQQLKGHILRILVDNEGEVRIVFMNPVSETAEKKSELFGKNYQSHITEFMKLLLEIREEVGQKGATERLFIRYTKPNSGMNISHMMIRTDEELYISPYFTAKKSHHPLVIQLNPDSAFGEGYIEDFEKAFSLAEKTGHESFPQPTT